MCASRIAPPVFFGLDWVNGSLLIRSSKTHSERILPMAQKVGEALVSYLRHGRPATSHRKIFLEADLATKERALSKLAPAGGELPRFKAKDEVLAFLATL